MATPSAVSIPLHRDPIYGTRHSTTFYTQGASTQGFLASTHPVKNAPLEGSNICKEHLAKTGSTSPNEQTHQNSNLPHLIRPKS
jgi:hypothetical protein